ncbi:MAG: hypothetical protein RJB13_905, partial [Pseudomonadota bacterium]
MNKQYTCVHFEIVKDVLTLELTPELGIVVLKFTDSATRNSITLEKSEALANISKRLQKPSA